MSIKTYMKKVCTDTLVYWATPVLQTDGSNDFDAPVEIACFWQDKDEEFRTSSGKEVVSVATVHVLQDLDKGCMIFHGLLTDLDSGEEADPLTKKDALEIKEFYKTPLMGYAGEFERKIKVGWRN